jgi:hypothetical protein
MTRASSGATTRAATDIKVLASSCAECRVGFEADTAVAGLRLESGLELGGVEARQKSVEQAKVHLADEVGVFAGQCVEGAVAEHDRVLVGARLEAMGFEDAHHGIGAGLCNGSISGCGGEVIAQLTGAPVERCPR